MQRSVICCSLLFVLLAGAALAQTAEVTAKPLSETDIALLRQDLQKAKSETIAEAMKFTDAEGKAFWPVYREYAGEQNTINSSKLAVVKEYARQVVNLPPEKAHDLTVRMLKVDEDLVALRQKYLPRFEQAIGGKRAAKFYQVDGRITMLLNLQLSSELPLIP